MNSLRSRGDLNLVNQGTEKKMLPSFNSYVDKCMFVLSRYGFLRSVDQKRAGGDDGNSINITSMCYPPALSPVVFNEQLKPVPSTGRGEGERESFWEGLVCFGRLGKN